jgi:hypothetical protein
VEEWRSGGVEEWRSGGVEEWRPDGMNSLNRETACRPETKEPGNEPGSL